MRAARPHKACGELVQIGLADGHGARVQEARNDRRRRPGRIGEGGTGCRRGQARQIDVVLYREGQAGQGQDRAGRRPAIDLGGGGEDRLVRETGDPGLWLDGVVGGDAVKGLAGGVNGAHVVSRAMIGAPAATASFSRA